MSVWAHEAGFDYRIGDDTYRLMKDMPRSMTGPPKKANPMTAPFAFQTMDGDTTRDAKMAGTRIPASLSLASFCGNGVVGLRAFPNLSYVSTN